MAAPPSAPSFGGMPDVGSGLSGLGQQLADAFGSLFGSADDGLPETPDFDEPALDDEPDPEVDDDEKVDPAADSEEEDPALEETVEPVVAEDTCAATEPPADPMPPAEPVATAVPPPLEPAPPPPEPTAAETPCEIAADELPQAGE